MQRENPELTIHMSAIAPKEKVAISPGTEARLKEAFFGLLSSSPNPAVHALIGQNGVFPDFQNEAFKKVYYEHQENPKAMPKLTPTGLAIFDHLQNGLSGVEPGQRNVQLVFVPGTTEADDKLYSAVTYCNSLDEHHELDVAVTYTDVTKEARELDQWKYRAEYDMVLGVKNRNALQRRLESLRKEQIQPGKPWAVIFGDVDEFKPVNEYLDHIQGDYYMMLIAFIHEISVRGAIQDISDLDRFAILKLSDPVGLQYRKAAEYFLEHKTGYARPFYLEERENPKTEEEKLTEIANRQQRRIDKHQGGARVYGEPQHDTVYRYGGDELVIELPELSGVDDLIAVVTKEESLAKFYNEQISGIYKNGEVRNQELLPVPDISLSYGGVMVENMGNGKYQMVILIEDRFRDPNNPAAKKFTTITRELPEGWDFQYVVQQADLKMKEHKALKKAEAASAKTP